MESKGHKMGPKHAGVKHGAKGTKHVHPHPKPKSEPDDDKTPDDVLRDPNERVPI